MHFGAKFSLVLKCIQSRGPRSSLLKSAIGL